MTERARHLARPTLGPWRSSTTRRAVTVTHLVLAVLAYVPALLSSPGRMPADTKLGLYLDPGRLISNARLTWDPSLFGGWVPHQMVAYLWPSGPWFWICERIGMADWVAHRLWIGTLLFAGGSGVAWLARRLGLAPLAALVAGVIYQCSPYLLAYVSRTSAMLLPWAAVGWVTGLAAAAATTRRWREPALIALIVATVGSVNATALMMIIPAPVLIIVHLGWQRLIPWRQAAIAVARIATLCLLTSLWWIVMVAIQRRHGADVLAYSETLRDVSYTATSTEAWRGLGYWLFYVRDNGLPTTTASAPYMTNPILIAVGWSLVIAAVIGLAALRWGYRRFAALCIVAGVLLAVGPHPLENSPPLWRPVGESWLSLAIRSSTRALPVSLLGISLAVGAATGALRIRRLPRWMPALAAIALAVLNLPALWRAELVDPALERDQAPPAAWHQAAAELDRGDLSQRVLQLPGQEFGAFTWGYTVDPPLASLTRKPLITRDLLPLGTPLLMDLLYAVDDRWQNGTAEPEALAALSRLLGADTIWLTLDADDARFDTPEPADVRAAVQGPLAGLGPVREIGVPGPNGLAPVALIAVDDPAATDGTARRAVLVVGSGDGVVDAAGAGLLDGHESITYAAEHRAEHRADTAPQPSSPPAVIILTDSNRDAARHWRGSQDVHGLTESTEIDAPPDQADVRLPIFPQATAADRTVTRFTGALPSATAYGSPLRYELQSRPARAVDGDPDTAWLVSAPTEPVGQSITLARASGPLRIRQAIPTGANRLITAIDVVDGAGPSRRLTIAADTVLDVPITGDRVTITIAAVAQVPGAPGALPGPPTPVGFAELGPVSHEIVVLPALPRQEIDESPASPASPETVEPPLAIVVTRQRDGRPDRPRPDPETVLRRQWTLHGERDFVVTATLRRAAASSRPVAAGCHLDLLTIDGAPVGLHLDQQQLAALQRGQPVTAGPCTTGPGDGDGDAARLGNVQLAGGTHHLETGPGANTGLDVDRVVLTSGDVTIPTASPAASQPVAMSPWQRPTGPGRAVQHVADVGLIVSALTVLGIVLGIAIAIVLGSVGVPLVRGRRLSSSATAGDRGQIGEALRCDPPRWSIELRPAPDTRGRAVLSAVALAAASALLIGPSAVVLGIVVGAAVAWTRRTQLLWWLAGGLVAVQGARVVVGVLRHSPAADSSWPRAFENLHRAGVFAVLVLAAAALSEGDDAAEPGRRQYPTG